MFKFSNSVSKLPHDHHELMAMVAPRALLVLGNPDYQWLADESGYVSCRAAHEVWKTFGIADRFGFSMVDGHGHCQLPRSQRPEVGAFVDKFLLGEKTANTEAMKSPYDDVDHARWTGWWGTENPVFPDRDVESQSIFCEAESATIGENWKTISSDDASGGAYVTVKPEMESVAMPPADDDDHIVMTFSVDKDATYYLFGRLDCPSMDDDSFWIRMDDGQFEKANELGTRGWEWVKISRHTLTTGKHSLTIAYRENGANLDRICISSSRYTPQETP